MCFLARTLAACVTCASLWQQPALGLEPHRASEQHLDRGRHARAGSPLASLSSSQPDWSDSTWLRHESSRARFDGRGERANVQEFARPIAFLSWRDRWWTRSLAVLGAAVTAWLLYRLSIQRFRKRQLESAAQLDSRRSAPGVEAALKAKNEEARLRDAQKPADLSTPTTHDFESPNSGVAGRVSQERNSIDRASAVSPQPEAAADPQPATPRPSEVAGTVQRQSRRRVLAMDDEPAIRNLLKIGLSDCGCDVTIASNGEEAVEFHRVAKKEREPFAFVLLDLTVQGGMGGLEALRNMREIDPDVIAVASTGYGGAAKLRELERGGFAETLAKPYKLKDLERIVSVICSSEG